MFPPAAVPGWSLSKFYRHMVREEWAVVDAEGMLLWKSVGNHLSACSVCCWTATTNARQHPACLECALGVCEQSGGVACGDLLQWAGAEGLLASNPGLYILQACKCRREQAVAQL